MKINININTKYSIGDVVTANYYNSKKKPHTMVIYKEDGRYEEVPQPFTITDIVISIKDNTTTYELTAYTEVDGRVVTAFTRKVKEKDIIGKIN